MIKMVVLGLDQATSTGYAVSDESGKILMSGHITVQGTRGEKFVAFRNWLEQMLITVNPDIIAHERPHFRGDAATELCVGLCAIIAMSGTDHGIPVHSVQSMVLKKWATGNGRAEKADMVKAAQAFTEHTLNVKKDNDEADAIHIARWGALTCL